MINIRVFLITILIWCNAAITFAAPYAAIVIDADTGKVLHFENANTRLHPAGLTKLATLYAAFEAAETREINLDAKARVSLKAANEELAALGMHEGQSISIHDLIRATAIKGANDTSTALAEAISGSEQAFTKRLDETAKELGLSRSTFKNAHGLTEKGHLSTANDMAFLMKAIADDFPNYLFVLGLIRHKAADKKITHSARRLLKTYEGAVAAKTGYTRAAGFNGVLLAERSNERIITVVFGGRSTTTMIAQISKLTDLGFSKKPSS
jgi:D-alanyl-D-alanine carboxypeptidase